MSPSSLSKMKYFILTIFLLARCFAHEVFIDEFFTEEETTTDGWDTTVDGQETEEPEVCQGGFYTNVG